ncbi:MAG: IS4 family transposase [bacterium]|nr:IS4 family transposase [bacterium]
MTPDLLTAATRTLATAAKPEHVREQARLLGVTVRQGKMDSYALLMVVVLGLVVRGQTSIAQLGHVYGEVTGFRRARSSFWARFSPPFSDLVKWLLDRLVTEARPPRSRPPGVLHNFTDVLAGDSSVIKVHDSLRGIWKGTRRNSAMAALKLHAWVRVFTGELVKYRITPEAYGDSRAFGIDRELRGVLMLFDRGYASPSLWRRIDSVGGYFLTRIPKGWNQEIASENRRHRGRARSLVGMNLRDALDGLKRSVVDVNVAFCCRVRAYSGAPARFVEHEFRVIALKRPDGQYAIYATNAPPRMLPAEEAWNVYRLRWEVETFFKSAKSGCALSDTPTRDKHRVLAWVYAAVIRATVAMSAKARFIRLAPARHRVRINPGQWMRWWNRQLLGLLDMLELGDGPIEPGELLLMLADPNRSRIPMRNAFGGE